MPNRFPYKLILFCLSCWTLNVYGAVLVKEKMWPHHTTLNVVFLDGTSAQKQLVKRYAPLWVEGTSLSFKFFDGWSEAPDLSHVRVSFQSYTGSTLGNHGDLKSKEATLLLAELQDNQLPEDYARRLVLHEFGHALGFEHEYRNPKWPFGQEAIKQQIQACYPRMQQLDYSEKEAKTKCEEINATLLASLANATVYDELSIMNYPQEIQLSGNRKKRIEARTKLSILDLLAMQRWYGKVE